MVVAQRKYHYVEEDYKNSNDNKEIKKKSKKIKTSHKLQIIFSLMIIASLCISIILGYVKLTEIKYKINALNKEIDQLEANIENLRVEVEGIKRSDLIEQKAKNEIGMQYPEKQQMVFLNIDNNKMVDMSNTKEKAEIYEENNKMSLIESIKGKFHKALALLD